ncbi:MAG: hypothetical protein RIS86_1070, partial [Planctomycetota bacterium]
MSSRHPILRLIPLALAACLAQGAAAQSSL